MDKREKVVEGLRTIVHEMQAEVEEWKDYSDSELASGVTVDCDWWLDAAKKCGDALELLKAQEPVKPEFVEHIEPDLSYWTCGACGAFIWGNAMGSDVIKVIYHPNYCQHCGREVKWDG